MVTHGLTIRLFIMRFFHLTVEEFEQMLSPANCDLVVLSLQENGKYMLEYDIKKTDKPLKYSRPICLD